MWFHTWGENWVNCAGLRGNSAGLRTVLSSIFHKEKCAVHSGNPTADTTMASSQGTSVSSNSITTWASHDIFLCKYSTFYPFFSSFRITLWPMWLANSIRQPYFYPPQSHAQEDTQNWQTWSETFAVPENIQFSFSCSFFYTVKLHSLTLSLWGPLGVNAFIQWERFW